MSQAIRVLVVDDDRVSRESTARRLRKLGYLADAAENAFVGLQRLSTEPWDVVLTDLRMPTMDGLRLLREIKRRCPEAAVVLMTAYATVKDAVAAMRDGAADFLAKPFDFEELHSRLKALADEKESQQERNLVRTALEQTGCCCGLVGRSAAMRDVYERIDLFARSSAPVLITGETGTGKELVARAIHRESSRAKGPFVAVACGAIPHELAESELFGHEKGAFTGALQRRRGSFERADKGTLLLDDVDDLPPGAQPKLLRALQEGKIVRVGAEDELSVDVRMIATTKQPLQEVIQEGGFREDLYYRLCGLEVQLPPLRDRGPDSLLLAHHFLGLIAGEQGSEPKTLSTEAADFIRGYRWPGNVRQLRRVLESAVTLSPATEIQLRYLPEEVRKNSARREPFALDLDEASEVDFRDIVREFEMEVIDWAMKAAGGEQQRAAKLLGLPRSTLQSKLQRLREAEGPRPDQG